MSSAIAPRTSAADVVAVRLSAIISPAQVNVVTDRFGVQQVLPGQGGVVLGHPLGTPAGTWRSDHLEPGASFGHPEPLTHAALQALVCVGNRVTVRTGAASSAEGMVYGKHGAILATFAEHDLQRLAPGDQAVIEAHGVGLSLHDFPDVAVHSCSPPLLHALLPRVNADGRLPVDAACLLPPIAAAAGIGMPANSFNVDLDPAAAPVLNGLDFGAIVALDEHDHRYGRQRRKGWVTIGAIVHGTSQGGGHGLGMISLISGPSEYLHVSVDVGSNLKALLADRMPR